MPLSAWTSRSFADRRPDAPALEASARAGSTVLDLSGALDHETGVLVRAPWVGEKR